MKYLFFSLLFIYSSAFAQKTAVVGYDLEIAMSLDTPPALNALSSLDYEISTNLTTVENVQIEVISTDGIVLNTLKTHKSLERIQLGIPSINTIDFSVNQPGQHKITIKVTGNVEGGKYTDRYEYVYFTTSGDARLNKLGWNANGNSQKSVSKYFPMLQEKYQEDSKGYIEVAMADENLNMITKKLKADDFYSSQKSPLGMVTISGTLKMRTQENNINTYFHANSLVQLLNGVSGAHRAWSYTNSQGVFTFPAIPNPGADGIIIRIYAVRFIAGGIGYGVCNKSFCTDNAATDSTQYSQFYSLLTSQRTGIPDGEYNYGTYILVNNTNLRAMWIQHAMNEANNHLLQNSPVRGPFTAEWSPSSTVGNYYSLGGNIHFKADVADGTNHTVLHEVGHNVMYNAGTFPTTPSDCPNPHFVNLISGTQCAWTEGWASAFANMVNDDPTRCFAPSATNCISYEVDPSFDVCFPTWDCGLDGHKVEGHVTGALWDLYDSAEDGIDINAYGANEIFSVMELSPYSAFLSWWTIWKTEGYPLDATNSLYQNAIEFTLPYDIDVFSISHTSNPSPVINSNFTLAVEVRNIGDVTSAATPVALYRSLSSIFNGFEPVVLNFDYLQIEKNASLSHDYILNEDEVGTFYYRACYNDAFGLDENNANDCSEVVSVVVAPLPELMFINGFE